MAKPSRFAEQAREDIEYELEKRNYRSAVLISAIYLQTRLTTLMLRGLQINDGEARTRFKDVFNRITLGGLITNCDKTRMISGSEETMLSKFSHLRNDIAHDLEMWGPLSSKMKQAIKHWCNEVILFMEETSDRKKPVRKRGKPGKLDYLVYEK